MPKKNKEDRRHAVVLFFVPGYEIRREPGQQSEAGHVSR
jgi:hypothetical protein